MKISSVVNTTNESCEWCDCKMYA